MKHNLILESPQEMEIQTTYLFVKGDKQVSIIGAIDFVDILEIFAEAEDKGYEIWKNMSHEQAKDFATNLIVENNKLYQQWSDGGRTDSALLNKIVELNGLAKRVKTIFDPDFFEER